MFVSFRFYNDQRKAVQTLNQLKSVNLVSIVENTNFFMIISTNIFHLRNILYVELSQYLEIKHF